MVGVFAVEQIADQFFFGDEVGPLAVELGDQGPAAYLNTASGRPAAKSRGGLTPDR
jgi:hypothetical protein